MRNIFRFWKTLDQIIDEYGTPKQFALKLKISYFSEEEQAENELVKNPKNKFA